MMQAITGPTSRAYAARTCHPCGVTVRRWREPE